MLEISPDGENFRDLDDRYLNALIANDAAELRVCLTCGADVNAVFRTHRGATPLHFAAAHRNSECLVELLQRNPQCRQDDDGNTPLHVAALRSERMTNIVLLCTSHGMSSALNSDRNSVLHLLLQNPSLQEKAVFEMMDWFSRQSSFMGLLNIINHAHATVLDLGMHLHRNNHDMLDLLIRKGAVRASVLYYEQRISLEVAERDERMRILAERKNSSADLHQRFHVFLKTVQKDLTALRQQESEHRAKIEQKEASAQNRIVKRQIKAQRREKKRLRGLSATGAASILSTKSDGVSREEEEDSAKDQHRGDARAVCDTDDLGVLEGKQVESSPVNMAPDAASAEPRKTASPSSSEVLVAAEDCDRLLPETVSDDPRREPQPLPLPASFADVSSSEPPPKSPREKCDREKGARPQVVHDDSDTGRSSAEPQRDDTSKNVFASPSGGSEAAQVTTSQGKGATGESAHPEPVGAAGSVDATHGLRDGHVVAANSAADVAREGSLSLESGGDEGDDHDSDSGTDGDHAGTASRPHRRGRPTRPRLPPVLDDIPEDAAGEIFENSTAPAPLTSFVPSSEQRGDDVHTAATNKKAVQATSATELDVFDEGGNYSAQPHAVQDADVGGPHALAATICPEQTTVGKVQTSDGNLTAVVESHDDDAADDVGLPSTLDSGDGGGTSNRQKYRRERPTARSQNHQRMDAVDEDAPSEIVEDTSILEGGAPPPDLDGAGGATRPSRRPPPPKEGKVSGKVDRLPVLAGKSIADDVNSSPAEAAETAAPPSIQTTSDDGGSHRSGVDDAVAQPSDQALPAAGAGRHGETCDTASLVGDRDPNRVTKDDEGADDDENEDDDDDGDDNDPSLIDGTVSSVPLDDERGPGEGNTPTHRGQRPNQQQRAKKEKKKREPRGSMAHTKAPVASAVDEDVAGELIETDHTLGSTNASTAAAASGAPALKAATKPSSASSKRPGPLKVVFSDQVTTAESPSSDKGTSSASLIKLAPPKSGIDKVLDGGAHAAQSGSHRDASSHAFGQASPFKWETAPGNLFKTPSSYVFEPEVAFPSSERDEAPTPSANQTLAPPELVLDAKRAAAATRICRHLVRAHEAESRLLYLYDAAVKKHEYVVTGTTKAVTRLVWRENFCCALKEALFARRRREAVKPEAPRQNCFWRFQLLTKCFEKYIAALQLLISLFLLIYMGCAPRTDANWFHNYVDLAFIIVLFILGLLLPLSRWRLFDLCLPLIAFFCSVWRAYGGTVVVTLLLLKFPCLVRCFAPEHSSTRTYCRLLRYTIFYLIVFSPLLLAGVGSSVRGTAASHLLLTPKGNWGSVFLYLWSTVSPQYEAAFVLSSNSTIPSDASPLFHMNSEVWISKLADGRTAVHMKTPLIQLIVCNVVLLFYTWSSVLVGTHGAIRRHYDISDQTKLKSNKHFRNDTHRATSMAALGVQVEGVMWDTDVRAAKEAIDASHYDHNEKNVVHRYIKSVRDTVKSDYRPMRDTPGGDSHGLINIGDRSKWDCRNEDPQSRGSFDIEIIETALGTSVRKGRLESFFGRQWTGPIHRRETTVIIIGMLVMASIKPNLYYMELVFSAVFAIELIGSLYALRFAFILGHYFRLLIRIFCIVVGFVPSANPYVVLRGLRLLEGWSHVYMIPGLVRWGAVYSLVTFLTFWMVSFVASLQFSRSHPTQSGCTDAASCLAISLRELVLPAWTEQHIDPVRYSPVSCVITIVSQLVFIPLVLSLALHPLLQLSNFIGRFLRQVLQALHCDMIDFLKSYLEGVTFYHHWRLTVKIKPSLIVRLKMMSCDRMGPHRANRVFNDDDDVASIDKARPYAALVEIISKGDFASFKDNIEQMASTRRQRLVMRLNRLRRYKALHVANLLLTLASFAFLWAASVTAPARSPVNVVASVVHLISVVSNILLAPFDLTAALTVVSVCSLIACVVLMSLSDMKYRSFYCVRFLSLLRLGQIQLFPLAVVRRFIRTYIDSGIKILLPFLFVGGFSYAAELLRAQIYMVRVNPLAGVNTSDVNATLDVLNNLSYTEYLAAYPHSRHRYENSRETTLLFEYFFGEDAYIFFSLFQFWLIPALCICSCLAYLFWSGANMRETQRLLITAITSLEDPFTMAGFVKKRRFVRPVANIVLIISVIFGSVFSPWTNATPNDFNFFFAFELVFMFVGLLEAYFTLIFAARRLRQTLFAHLSWRGHIVWGDAMLFVSELGHVLYYSVALPLCVCLLKEQRNSILSPENYATYFVTVRFVFLLRLLPRPYILSLCTNAFLIVLAASSIVIFFVTSASALSDLWAATEGRPLTASIWRSAFQDILRQTFTSAIPTTFTTVWAPNLGETWANVTGVSNTAPAAFAGSNYSSSRFVFILAIIGKAVLSCTLGLGIAVVLIPFHTTVLTSLPPKSKLLYETLCEGPTAVVELGMQLHDDMRPETRRRVQRQKVERMFVVKGIPTWAVPHLLEELDICRPARQRRFMFCLEKLLEYFPISEERVRRVSQYVEAWDCYRCGGPDQLGFSHLPVFPKADSPDEPNTPHPNPLSSIRSGTTQETGRRFSTERYVSPLRLVQALALFELNFPTESSVGSKLWIDFFSVVQKLRGATMMQSLWRMYAAQKKFERERTYVEQFTIVTLRRSFRKAKLTHDVRFRSYATFDEALIHEREVFNLSSSHFDILDRLRGHYAQLKPLSTLAIVPKQLVESREKVAPQHRRSRRESARQVLNRSMRSLSFSTASVGLSRPAKDLPSHQGEPE